MSEQATEQQADEKSGLEGLSPEEQASVEKGRSGLSEVDPNKQPEAASQKPDWVPEQFWKDGKVDQEGLAKSYSELRSKMDGKQPEAEEKGKEGEQKPATDATGKINPEKKDEAAEGEPTPLQQAMETARTEWADTQEVSEDTVAALEAAGIPKDVFNLYLEGLKAQTERDVAAIHGYAGGKDAYEAMTSWAAKTLSADEIEAFNDALDNPKLRETAVTGLLARFQKAAPSEGSPLTPKDTPSASSDVFTSRDELIAAQKDPRYGTDAKYRQEVVEKLARSQGAGFKAFDRPMFQREVLTK